MKTTPNQRKTNRSRSMRVERLENRELMAADAFATFNKSTGALTIQGTSSNDNVVLRTVGNATTVEINNIKRLTLDPRQVKSIDANLGGGSDGFIVTSSYYSDGDQLSPDRVDIALGSGVRQKVEVNFGRVNSLKVHAQKATTTTVIITDTVVDQLMLDFGTDLHVSKDHVQLVTSEIGKLKLQMGGGNDDLYLHESRIKQANVQMGAGNDVVTDVNSKVKGKFDGGSHGRLGDDLPTSLKKQVTYSNFNP